MGKHTGGCDKYTNIWWNPDRRSSSEAKWRARQNAARSPLLCGHPELNKDRRTARRQGFVGFVIGAGRSILWVMWVHVSNESDSCTKVLQFRGPPQMPISATFRHRNKNQCIMYRFNFAKNTPWYSLRALTSLNHEKYCNFCVGMIGLVYLHPRHLRFWVRLGGKSSRISRILTTQLVSTSLTSCFIVWNGIDLFKSSLTVILIYHKQGSVQLGHITLFDLLWMQCWAHPLWSQALRDSFG